MSRDVLNAFTVDVEDWFHVSAFERYVARDAWDEQPLRVEANTRVLLDMLDGYSVRGTFFVLGWVADRVPALVAEIAARGHEIGAHSWDHQLVYRTDPAAFRADLRRTADAIERAGGGRPKVYRAPSFSLTRESLWALDVLKEEGYEIDSSVFPVRHDRYGIADFPRHPFVYEEPGCVGLIEFPLTTLRKLGVNIPTAGGGYLRLFPEWLLHAGVRQANAAGCPALLYVHPWEIDPGQPRLRVPLPTRLRHYTGLERTADRLRRLLDRYRFGTLSEAAHAYLAAETAA